MLKIAVCDDGWTDIETLEKALDQFDQYPVDYDVFFSAGELLKYRKEHEKNYNMYIFDIEMPGMSGLELAKEIRKEDAKALFVFLTGYTSYVMDVFEVVTFDFIQKPATAEKLSPVLLKAASYLNLTRQEFVFSYRKNQFRIQYSDILYIEKKGRKAYIHTVSETFEANMTIEEIWKQLDADMFSHIHVSYIVNLQHIRVVEGDEVVLGNGMRLVIARSQKQALKEKHMDFIRRGM